MNVDQVWDAKQAAAYLKIHERTLVRMATRSEVPAFRIGRLWRFRASELDAWARSTVNSDHSSFRSN